MIVGKENILTWYRDLNARYWWLYPGRQGDKGVWITRSNPNDSATTSSSISELEKALSLLHHGTFTIAASEKDSLSARGFFRTDFELNSTDPMIMTAAPAVTGMNETEVQKKISEALDKYKMETELASARAKVIELEKEVKEYEKNDPWNKLAGIASEYLPMYLKGPGAAKIAGMMPASEPVEVQTPDLNDLEGRLVVCLDQLQLMEGDNWIIILEKIVPVLKTFKQYDPDYINTLQKMAAKLESNPKILTMIKVAI